MHKLPILTYHKISNSKEFGLTTVSPKKFKHQMQFLKSEGFESVGFDQLIDHRVLPEKPVIITFDDGYENVYTEAFPILAALDFKGVVFVVTDFLGKYNSWESASFQKRHKHLSYIQIIEMKKAGWEIGSHGRKHNYLPALNDEELEDEIAGSKRNLETIIDERVISFSYPYGRHSARVIKSVQKAGYAFATSNISVNRESGLNPYTLIRRSIYSTDTLNLFKNKLTVQKHLSPAYISEYIIQNGAFASIGLNMLRRHFIKF